jgi:hypothetical protein
MGRVVRGVGRLLEKKVKGGKMGVLLIILSRGLGKGRAVFNPVHHHLGGQFFISGVFMYVMLVCLD